MTADDWGELATFCALAWCWETDYGDQNRAEMWEAMGELAEERQRELILLQLAKEVGP